MSKHTPGPWGIFKGSIVQANADDTIPYNTKLIADISKLGQDCQEANARLIAASPRMLSVLESALERLTILDIQGEGIDILKRDISAAIAKAKEG